MLPSTLCLLAMLSAPLADGTGEPAATMRLFYPSAAWERVLGDIAELGELELVAPRVPSDRFEHNGVKQVEFGEALRIVNDQLTESGFRAMHRGDYLIVLKDETFQPTFPRFKYGSAVPPNANRLAAPDATSPGVRLASHEQVAGEAPIDVTGQPMKNDSATVIEPRVRTAKSIGRQLYDAVRGEAKLIDNGPQGLPAFVARVAEPITVAIDANENRLVFVGSDEATAEMVGLVAGLDRQPSAKSVIRLMAGHAEAKSAANEVRPALQTMLAMQDAPAAPADPPPLPNTAGDAGPEAEREQLTELLDQLRSDVAIESLDSLGLLILRGNERDVEAVSKIIAAIEQAGAGTSPEVHLRLLNKIDGEAVADLLNTTYQAVDQIETKPFRDGQRVVAIPVVRPNAVLIVAPAAELESALQLVDKLDEGVDPNTELTVIPLKGASATEAVETINEFYEERGGLGTRVRVSADPRTNALLVRAQPNDLAEIRTLVKSLDAEAAGSVSRVKIYPLEHAQADELAEFLGDVIEDILEPSNQAGGRQGQTSQRSVALEFFAGPGAGLLRSGVLSEVRVTGDPRTNTLAVVAPPKSQPMFDALIDALDQPAGATAEIKVFTLTNADASAASNLLTDLFVESTAASGDGPPGLRLTGASDAASNLLPVNFSVDVRTNSIIAVGGPDALTVVEAVLLRLDSANPRERITQVLKLKNAPADEVSEAINLFLESQRELAQVNPDVVSTLELLEREVIVVPEPISNNLLISATLPYYEEMLRIATELDARPPQVVIQALLVEVELDNLDELGVELGFQDSLLFDRSLIDNLVTVTDTVTGTNNVTQTTERIISQNGAPGFQFNRPGIFPNLGNNVGPGARPSSVAEQALSNFGVGRVSSGLDFGGLVLSASSDSLSVLIRALALRRDVHILSRPQIRTLDGQLAEIQVGQQVPIVNGVQLSTLGIAQPQIVYDEAGIILSVTPRIAPDGQIVMETVAERSAYINDGVPIFTDVNSGATIFSPIKNVTVARSTVSVQNGQTVVLGGMITQRDENITRKVPYLGDIPIIGRAFRYDVHDNLRTELIMFLTPRVIADDFDNETISEVESARLHFIREEAERNHGPLYGVPADNAAGRVQPPVLTPYEMGAERPTEPIYGPVIRSEPVSSDELYQVPSAEPIEPTRLPAVDSWDALGSE